MSAKNCKKEFIGRIHFIFARLSFLHSRLQCKNKFPCLLDTRPVRALFLLAYLMMVLSVLYLLTEVYNLMQTKQSIGTRVSLTKILYKIFDCIFLIGYILLIVLCILNFSAIDFPENIVLLLLPFCLLLDSSKKSFICSTLSISKGIYFFIFLLSL